MMFPRRVPFIGDVPLPMISSCPRSLTSPTSTHTFEVPMSRATMYLSSVFGMLLSSILERGSAAAALEGRRRGRRTPWLHDDAVLKAEVRVLDGAAGELLVRDDGVEVAPLRREVAGAGVDERAELAVEDGEAARRHGTDLGDARVELGVARAEVVQQGHAVDQLGAARAADDGKVGVADRGRQLRERDAVVVDVVQRSVAQHERHRRPLDDA